MVTMVPIAGPLVVSGGILAQPQVRARLIVVERIRGQAPPQMPFAEDQDVIQQSRRSVPIRRSTYGFCHGDHGDVGRSRIPIARTRLA